MMPDPNRPQLSPAQLANLIGERIPNTDHPLAVCYVLAADGTDVACNVKDYDPAVHKLSPNTPVVPDNAPADFKPASKSATAPAATGSLAPAAPPIAPVPPAAPQYEGAPQVFTMPNGTAGFFRSDSMGRRLNPTDYPTQEAAAASAVTLNGFTGEPL